MMTPEYEKNWYSFDDAKQITGLPDRTLRRHLAGIPQNCIRAADQELEGRGRPRNLYHFTVHPRLTAHHTTRFGADPVIPEQDQPVPEKRNAPGADDLAVAELRKDAVLEFEARKKTGLHSMDAAIATTRDWERNPRTRTVQIDQRLRHYKRDASRTVALGGFSVRSLYRWESAYNNEGLLALCPNKKGNCGRDQEEISQELLKYVYFLSNSTARACVERVLPKAKAEWVGTWPDVSLATWCRRLNELDPRHAAKDLMHSIRKFRTNHSPDIETDWESIGYNDVWMIDDIQQDWYTLDANNKWLRPYAYAIVRARTRQWVAVCSSECPITAGQVRALIGWAMVSPSGGIPKYIKFEHGTVAGDERLFDILSELGVEHSRTSMDSGRVFSGAAPDVGQGHPQGKAIIERRARGLHEQAWDAPLQVGGYERETAPVRHEKNQAAILQAKERGEAVIIPQGAALHAYIAKLIERHNDTPCESHARAAFPDGQIRHFTPNEIAKQLVAEEIRTMPEEYMPLFAEKGIVAPVTKNGIKINHNWYGKFDEDLTKLPFATAFVNTDCPDVVYIEELGRCLEAYTKTAFGDASQIPLKRKIEEGKRNLLEAAYQTAVELKKDCVLEAVRTFKDPALGIRKTKPAESAELTRRTTNMKTARATWQAAKETSNARFELPLGDSPRRSPPGEGGHRRSGLLARSEQFSDELAAIGAPDNNNTAQEDSSWQH